MAEVADYQEQLDASAQWLNLTLQAEAKKNEKLKLASYVFLLGPRGPCLDVAARLHNGRLPDSVIVDITKSKSMNVAWIADAIPMVLDVTDPKAPKLYRNEPNGQNMPETQQLDLVLEYLEEEAAKRAQIPQPSFPLKPVDARAGSQPQNIAKAWGVVSEDVEEADSETEEEEQKSTPPPSPRKKKSSHGSGSRTDRQDPSTGTHFAVRGSGSSQSARAGPRRG